MKYILIRDDDLNYHTDINHLKVAYEYIFENDIPINFATIPAVNTSSKTSSSDFGEGSYEPFIPVEVAGVDREWEIDKNRELIEFLSTINNAEYLLHGYSHKGEAPLYEFEENDEKILKEKLNKGLEIYKRAFKAEPKTFVAPQDKYSAQAFSMIKEKFDIFSLGWIDKSRISFSQKVKYYIKKITKDNFIKDSNITIIEHPGCLFSKFKPQDESIQILDRYISNHDISIIVVHHWEFFDNGKANVALIESFKNKMVELNNSNEYKIINFKELSSLI